jgi:hypothetical protein
MKLQILLTASLCLLLVSVPQVESQVLKTTHPRLMDQQWIDRLTAWSNDPSWEPYQRFESFANRGFGDAYDAGRLFSKALMWRMGKGDSYRTECLNNFDSIVNGVGTNVNNIAREGHLIAMAYDLLYHELSPSSQRNAVDQFIQWQDAVKTSGPVTNRIPFWNYAIRQWGPAMVAASAGAGDPSNLNNDLGSEYAYWRTHYFDPGLYWANAALKGEMPEGTYYGTIDDARYFLIASEAVFMAEGEDVYSGNEWYGKRLDWEWQTFLSLPKFIDPIKGDPGRYYHPWGHSERVRATVPGASRLNTLMLLTRFPSHPHSGQIYSALYENADPDLNRMTYDSTYYSAVIGFIYGAKDLEPFSEPPSLQMWSTNVNTAYGPGKVFMRSGYGPDDIHISYKAGDMFYRGHENLEEGSFQVFAKGEDLAIHSGSYAGSGELTQTVQYWSSTVSTNSLIVYDPQESFWFVGQSKDNDGGQRTYTDYPQMYSSSGGIESSALTEWETNSRFSGGTNPPGVNHHGSVLRAGSLQDKYSYAYSDITRAYNSDDYIEGEPKGNSAKVELVTREIALLDGKFVIVFDKLRKKQPTDYSASPSEGEPYPYQDKWLLHSQEAFSVSGVETSPSSGEQVYSSTDGSFSTTVNNAKLHGKVVVPSTNYQIRRFNGPKQYWNYQRNIPLAGNQGNWYDIEWGRDRIEIEPTDSSLDHYYLVVLYPEHSSGPQMPEVQEISGSGIRGSLVMDPSRNVVAIFNPDMSGLPLAGLSYAVTADAPSMHFISGLEPDSDFEITINGIQSPGRSSAAGVLFFEEPGLGSLDITISSGPSTCTDFDNDGYFSTTGCGTLVDCNDQAFGINPGVAETCGNGVDENCDPSDDACQPSGPVEIIIDNGENGFSSSGTWSISSYPGYYGTSSLWSSVNEGSTASWTPDLPVGGIYAVHAWWTSGDGRVIDAKYTANHADGQDQVEVNQKLDGGEWNLLGAYRFNPGTAGYVSLSDSSSDPNIGGPDISDSVCADAVRFSFISSDYHQADNNPQDGCIQISELVAFIDLWKSPSGGVTMSDLMEAIRIWKAGIGCN